MDPAPPTLRDAAGHDYDDDDDDDLSSLAHAGPTRDSRGKRKRSRAEACAAFEARPKKRACHGYAGYAPIGDVQEPYYDVATGVCRPFWRTRPARNGDEILDDGRGPARRPFGCCGLM